MINKDDLIVEKQIGKNFLQMRESHRLPFYLSEFHFYDRALPRICKEVNIVDGYLKVVDVGANIGDTVSLIADEVRGSFLCVEGDDEYLPFLKINTNKIKESNIFIEESYCTDSDIKNKKIKIRRENGTARLEEVSAIDSSSNIRAKTLNDIIKDHVLFRDANLLKIDTDGFEINVLKGGEEFLQNAKPIIYFEFDPEFYLINNDDPLFVFDFLHKNGYYEALFYDNFGIPVKILDISNKGEIIKLVDSIDKKNIYYFDVLVFHDSKKEKYKPIFESELFSVLSLSGGLLNSAKAELGSASIELNSIKTEMNSIKTDLDLTKIELTSIRTELDSTKLELSLTKTGLELSRAELINVYNSREWRLILKLQKLFKLIFPVNSLRRKILVKLFRFSKKVVKIIFKIKREISEIFLKSKNYLAKFRPRKKRKINLKSKKLVYIGHSYHSKTKSTGFLIDYLKEFFDVEVVLDESWQGKPAPDLSFIDESYLGVIFFQLLPSREVIDRIKNDNIIYFPMYDQSGRLDYDYWKNYHDLKIANFSSTLHKKLKKWNFESMYVQYFLDPQEFKPGKKDEVFFWQRLTKISISTIIRLLNKEKVKIHIHKAIDPDQEFMQPKKEDEDKFKITYSEWYGTREEMLEVVNQKGIYIAPREYEGIGLSFLEAMAKGKAVIAVNNPTMNEYIEHGKNGYLYDLDNPKEIDLSNIEEVQKNTYRYMQEGYKKWKDDRKKIINFIKQA